jgi:hypothetical protein
VTEIASTQAERLIVEAVGDCVGRRYPVLMWGSRATGDAAEHSDYDLFVVPPARKVPFAMRPLEARARSLESRLGVSVSLNPLPRVLLRRSRTRLSLWKLRQEARVLAAPSGFELDNRCTYVPDEAAAFSYLMSAVVYLIEPLEDLSELSGDRLRPELQRGVRKALLHATQLQLLEQRRYATRLADALEQLNDEELVRLANTLDVPATWFALRDRLLAVLPPPNRIGRRGRGLVVNAQYAALAAIAGTPAWRAAFSGRRIDARLAEAAIALASAPRSDGSHDRASVRRACLLLPGSKRDSAPWPAIRDRVVCEWRRAHRLMGI